MVKLWQQFKSLWSKFFKKKKQQKAKKKSSNFPSLVGNKKKNQIEKKETNIFEVLKTSK